MRGFLLGVVAIPAILALAALLYLAWTNDPASELGVLLEESERERDLAVRIDAARMRYTAHGHIAGEVIEGRLSLLEAAGRFRDTDRTNPAVVQDWHRVNWPGRSEEEYYCRTVIAWVQALSQVQPERARRVARQLEAELAELLCSADLRLP